MLFINLPSKAQFDEIYYNREFTYGLMANTNTFFAGFTFKYSRMLNDDVNHHIGFDMTHMKHPKEERYTNQLGNTFTLDKQYYVFPFRLNYGREYVIFRKTPYEGMQMSANFALGPTFALVKPYFVLYREGDRQVYEPYDPLGKHQDPLGIIDGGGFFRGLDRGRFELGFHIKSSIAFEFGKFGDDVAGVELGYLIEGYNRTIAVLPSAANSPIFSTGFLTLFYGKRK